MNLLPRRTVLAAVAVPWLAGCGSPLPIGAPPPAADPGAQALLDESAEAHGLAAFRRLHDVNIGYDGQWRPLIGRIQPEVVDEGYRGRSEERLLPADGLYAQSYRGPQGTKQVVRRRARPVADGGGGGGGGGGADGAGEVAVWFNGVRSSDEKAEQAAALVADGYALFLLGPMTLAGAGLPVVRAGDETVDGRRCEVIDLWLSPGLGQVRMDRISLCVDPRDRLTRRIRFTLEGFPGTRGAVAEVDTFDHERRFGVAWPMRSYERIVHPIAMPAHDWRVTGLDVNRGYSRANLEGPAFTGNAAAPAGGA